MIIKSIIQIKNNEYKIIVEKGDPFLLFDETIIEYKLLVGTKLSDEVYDEIINYNKLMKEYFILVRKIKQKLKTKKEITTYLYSKEYKYKDIQIIINKLIKVNLLDENNYIEAYINDSINLTLKGPLKITSELVLKGLNQNDITNYLNDINESIWTSKIEKIILKKSKSYNKYSYKEKNKKIKVYLKTLGYPDYLININYNLDNNDNDIISKDIDKLIKKYKNKNLSEKELFFKIKIALYRKGYSESDIINNYNKKNEE